MNGFKSNTYSLAGFKHNPKHDLFNYRFKRFKAETCQKKWSWFNQLCKGTNARIVISSVWRRDFTIDEWNQVFKKMKFEYIKIIGITETNHTLRGTEIKDWLDKYSPMLIIDNYVIIDDDSDMLEEQMSHFFQTDNWCGLTPTVCYKISKYLNNGRTKN
jgi:hypothetical protein